MSLSAYTFCFICALFTSVSAINDPELSNYFIGEFSTLGATYIPVPYPPGYCLKDGLIGSFVEFQCSTDKNTVTKKTYTPNDDECSGPENEAKRVTYTSDSSEEYGDLYDFNCAGKDNAMAYVTYLGSCDATPVGIVWQAIDICYKYSNLSNITGNLGNYPEAQPEEYYQLSQMNMCEGCDATLETYVGEQCPNKDKPLSRFTADPGCDVFFINSGFEVYADLVACVKNGVDSFSINGTCEYIPPTTTEADMHDNTMRINVYWAVIIGILGLMLLMFFHLKKTHEWKKVNKTKQTGEAIIVNCTQTIYKQPKREGKCNTL